MCRPLFTVLLLLLLHANITVKTKYETFLTEINRLKARLGPQVTCVTWGFMTHCDL